MNPKNSLVLQDSSFQRDDLLACNDIIKMDHFLSDDKHKVLALAESHNIALELRLEHAHRRRHQAFREVSDVQYITIDKILKFMLDFKLIP